MLCGGGIARSNTLAETAQLIGVQGIAGSLVVGISMQLAVFKNLPVAGSKTERADGSGPSSSINALQR